MQYIDIYREILVNNTYKKFIRFLLYFNATKKV